MLAFFQFGFLTLEEYCMYCLFKAQVCDGDRQPTSNLSIASASGNLPKRRTQDTQTAWEKNRKCM
jgi:hypothetical protein